MVTRNLYAGRQVAFLTQHGKQALVRAPLEAALDCKLVHTSAYDTDQLGTFTREQNRPGSQLDAARTKAKIGMSLTGTDLGMASEGAFGPDPFGALMPWNTEVLVWIDQTLGLEVVATAHGPAQSLHKTVHTQQELEAFAMTAKFPEHHLVLRPQDQDHPDIYKGLNNWADLFEAFNLTKHKSSNGRVFVENDLRAHGNPTRQEVIRQAADKLIQKLLCACPQCNKPGYWRTSQITGLPCRACGRKTHLPIIEIWSCSMCGHEDQKPLAFHQLADPSRCDFCNP